MCTIVLNSTRKSPQPLSAPEPAATDLPPLQLPLPPCVASMPFGDEIAAEYACPVRPPEAGIDVDKNRSNVYFLLPTPII